MTIIEITKFDARCKNNRSPARKIGKRNNPGLIRPTKLYQRTKDKATNGRADEKKGLVAGTIK